jgi:hypothetical protein
MTTTDTKAPAFTYAAEAAQVSTMSFGRSLKVQDRRQGVVRRSDGKRVWTDKDTYPGPTGALRAAEGRAAWLASYLAENGACYFDRQQAAKAHAEARDKARNAAARELMNAASAGTKAAFSEQPETACPYSRATHHAEAIIWTEAYRRTVERLTDFDTLNPEPVQP